MEKRFPPGSQIQTDYLQLKLVENLKDEETWRSCLVRFIKVLNNARRAQTKVTKYGNPAVMYSYPPDAPGYKTVTQPVKKTSPPPQPLHRGEQPRSEVVSIVAPGCRNCGRDHFLKNCPYIDCPGINTDHSVDWVASKAGHSWKYWCGRANGERGARVGRLSYRVSRLEAS